MDNLTIKKKFELLVSGSKILIYVTECNDKEPFNFLVECRISRGEECLHSSHIGAFDDYKRAEKVAFETFDKIMQRIAIDKANDILDLVMTEIVI